MCNVVCQDLKNENNVTFHVRTVVVAIPTILASQISFSPPLQLNRLELCSLMKMGSIIKNLIFYSECWWKRLGFSGEAVDNSGISFRFCFDASHPDAKNPSLVAFVLGDLAREFHQIIQ